MEVEIAYAGLHKQTLLKITVSPATTIYEALISSGILQMHPELPRIEDLVLGVFAKRRNLDSKLNPGDRVEIYRQLRVHPMIARKERAKLYKKAKTSK